MPVELKLILEAALLAAGRALSLEQLQGLFEEAEQPDRTDLRRALQALEQDYAGRAIELREVAGGYRLQVRQAYAASIANLWQERAPRYSRALLETLAIIAYRQPVTRGEIEDIRGVAVASNIIKTLSDRDWIRVVGRRDVPGRPALYATTREFLDYFDLKSLDQLPTLAEIRDFDSINRELDLNDPDRLEEPAPATPSQDQS
ncbi:MAG: SMC-Scp complex subunit ScpB [Gammaproteobacteria bacterium SHHR-1]|uniref:SMC-Scp complex subunit ScpB n=1 Tax=Magnetovirga frankeli TaxID=947516 RepID=UPI0012930760|nr:SMC-Scp complex subunit ScpB [gamma proteobacterium SS-5]